MGLPRHTLFPRLTRDRKGTSLMMNKICSFVVYLFLFSCLPLSAQDSLTILFAGDAMMHQTQLDNTRKGDSFDLSGYFSNIEKEVKAADIAVVNLRFHWEGNLIAVILLSVRRKTLLWLYRRRVSISSC